MFSFILNREGNKERSHFFLLIAWLQAVVATFGSLFFSEVLKYPPCVLCWYQRIVMYHRALCFTIQHNRIGDCFIPQSTVLQTPS